MCSVWSGCELTSAYYEKYPDWASLIKSTARGLWLNVQAATYINTSRETYKSWCQFFTTSWKTRRVLKDRQQTGKLANIAA